MEYGIYLDVLFFTNFTVDLSALLISRLIFKYRSSFFRTLSAAVLLSLCPVFEYCAVDIPFFLTFFIEIAVVAVSVFIYYGKIGIRKYIIAVISYVALLFCFGAVVLALIYLLPSAEIYFLPGGGYYFDLSFLSVFLVSLSVTGIAFIIQPFFERRCNSESEFDVVLTVFGHEIVCKGFLDTGNSLSSGIFGNPVIVAEKKLIEQALPQEINELFTLINTDDIGNFPADAMKYFKPVAVKTVSGNNILPAFDADGITVSGKKCDKCVTVAVFNGSLGKYPLLLNREITEKRK